ncbi:M56 family metallopeptidase [Cryomorpha ignava]|uniref:M56 family metallopeptidase n=1 Tax=Cryomorpha ignava TaxID=101383 RepID=A0A7K3WPY9_9FLAO|nr:M56 family metallopeptidase [Cryomorpha ignava]NEN23616.1 M56 family metallopeptidase [Cryomorpha ignava]
MNAFLIYILELNLYLSLFAVAYFILYKNEPYHRVNRWLILSSVTLSALLPLLSFGKSGEVVLRIIELEPILIFAKADVAHTPVGSNLPSLFTAIYIIGFGISMIAFAFEAFRLKKLIDLGRKQKEGAINECVNSELKSPASFFNTIIWSENIDSSSSQWIKDHELVHIREKHSIDLLILRFFEAVCWFNPLTYLLRHSLEATHEFRADEVVAKKHGDTKLYSKILLSQAMDISPNVLAHQFSKTKLLKRRIMMLNKQSRRKLAYTKYLALIPILAAAFILNACTDEQSEAPMTRENVQEAKTESSKIEGTDVYQTADEMPEYPGGQSAMMSYLGDNIEYPEECKKEGVEGTVYLSFVIDTDGKPSDIKAVRSPDERLSANATEVVKKMPKWKPGKEDGKNVKVQYSLPIKYQLK